ncbi:MAG: patatin-like phospholipase family protein [Bacteroidales bacterium]|nr:patatin-like phospholipase family protein [Bacteroidales bacterium]
MFLAVPSGGQEYPNGLSIDSVDPQADAVIIARMRERMDSIHMTQHRPTVALVLSGGGAKGSAHVGVIRYLEEQGIPVDMICGTSMGGLVGGIASLGYNSAFMDSLLRNQDWGVTLTDKIDPSYFSYTRKRYKETYVVSIPFHYAKRDFQSRIDEQVQYYGTGSRTPFGENNFASSLPSGYVYGFNVNNLLSSLSVGYQDNMTFDKLPIPYFCVAADMVSLRAKNWSSGSVKEAMRSTMSIPVMFKPVRSRGTILVDGGTRNNFPVDIARAMGADIVIGVDLSDQERSYSLVNNLGDIVMQFVSMLGKTTFDKNVGETDVFIKPVLTGYNMLSFTPEAIDTMIHRGYVAARLKAEELAEVKELTKGAVTTLQGPPAVDINKTPVTVQSVEFQGLTNAESRLLQRKIKIKAGETVDKARMDHVMSMLQATGSFSQVTYSILGREEPYSLVFDCAKGPRHQFGMGIRFDTEEWPAFLFNVGFNAYKLSGFKMDIDAKVGRNQRFGIRTALDLTWLPTINLEASVRNVSSTLYTQLDKVGSEARWWGHTEKVYLSNMSWSFVDFKAGAQYRQFFLPYGTTYGASVYDISYDLATGAYLGFFGTGAIYSYDRSYYPTRGTNFVFGYDYDFKKIGVDNFTPLQTAYVNYSAVWPITSWLALVPDAHARVLLGSPSKPDDMSPVDPAYSIAHQNYVGGFLADRYIDGQLPFIGFGDVYQAGTYAFTAGLGLRLRFGRHIFATATGGYFREANTVVDFLDSFEPTLLGAGFELGYTTPIGPIKVLGTWSDRFHSLKNDTGLYISFGFDF